MATTKFEQDAPSLSERRRQASRELMRAEILTAAQHIIRTQGLDALSLRALARGVGVTAPALYEYFDSKDAILKALLLQGSEVMLARMDERIAQAPPGLQTLQSILTGYRAFAREEPDYFRLLFGTVDPTLGVTDAEYSGMKSIFERFVGVIVSCIEAGELKPLPPFALSCSLWALIHGAALLETESFMSRKKPEGSGTSPQFDAAVRLTLIAFATPAGARLIEPVEDSS
jgi:AcrR family transcriptional regulator